MNSNLTQSAQNEKFSILEPQRKAVIVNFRNARKDERAAIIRHLDGILPTCERDERIFWLKVRRELERISETTLPI